jgi:hypothetical protein
MQAIRTLIQGLIVGTAVFGILSSILRKKKVLALSGLRLAMTAAALGGSTVEIKKTLHDGPAIGLDWFLLDLLLTALIFVPLERLWPLHQEQGTFRREWNIGCGVLHVHSSPNTDPIFSDFVACGSVCKICERA